MPSPGDRRKPGTAPAVSSRGQPADGGPEFQPRLYGISPALRDSADGPAHERRESGARPRTDPAYQPDEFLRQPLRPRSAAPAAGKPRPAYVCTELRRPGWELLGGWVFLFGAGGTPH